jgi:16S rRNA (cytidine1402-2'-O)-methyltransferase
MTLYLVGTPIGHQGDMTPRAREVLGSVPVVACEDTRTCRKLFSWLDLPAPELVVYHDHNVESALPKVLGRLEAGDDVALVTDAGMPAIQDPGYRLVVAARKAGISVVPVPGPTALILALAASGLPTDRFAFLGFAPRRGRAAWWREALAREETVVVYEAPTRVAATVAEVAAVDPVRPVFLARELTKVHEEHLSGPAGELADALAARESIRGECVIVVGGSGAPAARAEAWPDALAAVRATPAAERLSSRDLVEVLASVYPNARNAIYRAVIECDGES